MITDKIEVNVTRVRIRHGRVGTRTSKAEVQDFGTPDEATKAFNRLLRAQQKKGYRAVPL